MSVTLCTRTDLVDLLLEDYLAACEAKNPGLADRTIKAVSGEVRDMLAYRYPQPWPLVPDLVRYIASVISAYRVVEAITSLVDSEASVDNAWIPLQKQWKYCTDLLQDIKNGKTKLDDLVEANADREDASIAVVAPPPYFDFKGF